MASDLEPRRADARRSIDAILVAARDVLAEDPAATLSVVAERAGVHRATLYRHFANREALVRALHGAALDDVEACVFEADPEAEELLAEVEALVRRVYEANLAWRTHGWAAGYSSGPADRRRREVVAAHVNRLLTAAQDRGVLRRDLSHRELLATWGGPTIYLTGRIADGGWTLDEVVAYTMRMLTP